MNYVATWDRFSVIVVSNPCLVRYKVCIFQYFLALYQQHSTILNWSNHELGIRL